MNRIKAKLEQLYHRLQGHLLVTYQDYKGKYVTVWAVDVHTFTEYLPSNDSVRLGVCIDFWRGGLIELEPSQEFTITGA